MAEHVYRFVERAGSSIGGAEAAMWQAIDVSAWALHEIDRRQGRP